MRSVIVPVEEAAERVAPRHQDWDDLLHGRGPARALRLRPPTIAAHIARARRRRRHERWRLGIPVVVDAGLALEPQAAVARGHRALRAVGQAAASDARLRVDGLHMPSVPAGRAGAIGGREVHRRMVASGRLRGRARAIGMDAEKSMVALMLAWTTRQHPSGFRLVFRKCVALPAGPRCNSTWATLAHHPAFAPSGRSCLSR